MNGLHLLKASQRMALGDKFINGTLVQRSSDQKNDVVNHVTVRNEIKES